ncbi:MAG: NmrA family NAD(P)-binding protein [Rubrivivax sp.]|nr:NmrA family NAD(P)-binding protein [Rubrivivax sp.]
MKTALVLGARGRLGDACVQAFARSGWRVAAQVRPRPGDAAPEPANVMRLALALDDTAALARAAAGAAVVVHAVNPVYTRWEAEALPALRQGMAVARALGARLMLPGNVYVYGQAMPPRLDEATPIAPDTPHGRIRAEMEAALEADSSLRSTVIRAGDFFGHGRGSWLDLAIAKDLARGRLVYPGPLDRPHAWAYLPDLAQAFVAVAECRDDGSAFETLHFAGHTATGAEFIAALQEAAASLGLTPPGGWRVGGFPWPLIRVAGLVWPMGRALAAMSHLWRTPHALEGRRLADRVGPGARALDRPLADALRQALIDLGHRPDPLAAPASALRG